MTFIALTLFLTRSPSAPVAPRHAASCHADQHCVQFKHKIVYLNDEKHPILYYRCAIWQSAYTQSQSLFTYGYSMFDNWYRKSRDKLSSRFWEKASVTDHRDYYVNIGELFRIRLCIIQVYPDLNGSPDQCLPSGSFVTCSNDNTIRIWNCSTHLPTETPCKRNIYSNVSRTF